MGVTAVMSTMRVLLVDTDQNAAEHLRALASDYEVDISIVNEIAAVWSALRSDRFDALLSRNVAASVHMCQEVMHYSEQMPVLVVDARMDPTMRISCLENGASEVVVHNPADREIVAMLRAWQRVVGAGETAPVPTKPEGLQGHRFVCDDFEADFRARVVRVDSEERRLSTTQTAILRVLAEHVNRSLTRDEIMELAYARPRKNSRCVDAQITQLRRLIEAKPNDPRIIQTVWGTGYRLSVDTTVEA